MICPKNGDCMMNTKIHTGVDFCATPTCLSPRAERMAIAKKITNLLKKENLKEEELGEINRLKALYAENLRRGR